MKKINVENLKDNMEKIDTKSVVKKIKKAIIITLSGVVILGGACVYAGYKYIKSNENYTQTQCEKIALEKVPGEIIRTTKSIDDDSLSLVYEFKIKAKDNVLNEVDVDSKSGAIIDMDYDYNINYYKNN